MADQTAMNYYNDESHGPAPAMTFAASPQLVPVVPVIPVQPIQWIQPIPMVAVQVKSVPQPAPVVAFDANATNDGNGEVQEAMQQVVWQVTNTGVPGPIPGNGIVYLLQYVQFNDGHGLYLHLATLRVQEVFHFQIQPNNYYEGYGQVGWIPPADAPNESYEGEGQVTDSDLTNDDDDMAENPALPKVIRPFRTDEVYDCMVEAEEWIATKEYLIEEEERDRINRYMRAIRCFSNGLRYLRRFTPKKEAENVYFVEMEILILSRLASCYFNVLRIKKCIVMCVEVLERDPQHAYVTFLLAKAQLEMKKYLSAYDLAEKAAIYGFAFHDEIEEFKEKVRDDGIENCKLDDLGMVKRHH